MKAIAAKLIKIMKDCAYVQKTGYNEFHKYKYAKAADVLEKANESMVENGVCSFVFPEIISLPDAKVTTVRVTVNLFDVESGETMQLVGIGSGADTGDKAVMKAQTAALKYAWMMSLNIATGDDPEADESTDKNNAKPPVANSNIRSGMNTPPKEKNSATGQTGGKKEDADSPVKFKKKQEDGTFVFVEIDQLSNSQILWYSTTCKDVTQKEAALAFIKEHEERFPPLPKDEQ